MCATIALPFLNCSRPVPNALPLGKEVAQDTGGGVTIDAGKKLDLALEAETSGNVAVHVSTVLVTEIGGVKLPPDGKKSDCLIDYDIHFLMNAGEPFGCASETGGVQSPDKGSKKVDCHLA